VSHSGSRKEIFKNWFSNYSSYWKVSPAWAQVADDDGNRGDLGNHLRGVGQKYSKIDLAITNSLWQIYRVAIFLYQKLHFSKIIPWTLAPFYHPTPQIVTHWRTNGGRMRQFNCKILLPGIKTTTCMKSHSGSRNLIRKRYRKWNADLIRIIEWTSSSFMPHLDSTSKLTFLSFSSRWKVRSRAPALIRSSIDLRP
jgi:hypothetical protein